MQVWKIPPAGSGNAGRMKTMLPCTGAATTTPVALHTHTASSLIDCIARDDFGLRALARLNVALPVAWWSVYRVYADQPPVLCTLGRFEVPDIALECFRIYRSGPYLHDTTFLQARDEALAGAAGQAVLAHCVADDFGTVHREQIYQRHGLSERLSVVSSEGLGDDGHGRGGELLAINLYRHRDQARFNPMEIDAVFDLASPLMAVVRRHLELMPALMPPLLPPPRVATPRNAVEDGTPLIAEATPKSARQRLQQLCPTLTQRELQVCERMLRGWTFEGIGADMGLSATTVKTYRNRAFDRLGIHFRNQLFSLMLGGGAAVVDS